MKARAHIFVSGRVQGVFFRVETRQKAIQKNVTGWVRNTPDGRVEAVFEGKQEKLEKLIAFCRNGPPAAKVTKVEIHWEDPSGEFTDFRILRTVRL